MKEKNGKVDLSLIPKEFIVAYETFKTNCVVELIEPSELGSRLLIGNYNKTTLLSVFRGVVGALDLEATWHLAVAKVLTNSLISGKYTRDDWKTTKNATMEYSSAAVRHLGFNLTSLDEYSKLPHGYHLLCNLMFLVYLNYIHTEKN